MFENRINLQHELVRSLDYDTGSGGMSITTLLNKTKQLLEELAQAEFPSMEGAMRERRMALLGQ
jgi:hypothetical protein